MAIAIKNRGKWELAGKDIEIYKKICPNGYFEGTNEEVARQPKFLAIFDEIIEKAKKVLKPKTEKEKKMKEIEKKVKEVSKKVKKAQKEVKKLVKRGRPKKK